MVKIIKKKTLFLLGLAGLSVFSLFHSAKDRSGGLTSTDISGLLVNTARADVPHTLGGGGGPDGDSGGGPDPCPDGGPDPCL